MKILVVEDERHVAEAVKQLLADLKYAVDIASDGAAGLEMAEAFAYDLIVLDIGLPQLDGIELCRRLRDRHFENPILLLTGRGGSENKAIALNAGADDYVVKPFDTIELVARVQALLRRPANGSQPILAWGNLTFDPNKQQVRYGDRLLILTPKEYAILELLLRCPRSLLSPGTILERVWTADKFPTDEAVRNHIKELRHKFVAVDAPKDLIKTVYGMGYQLNPLYAAGKDDRSSISQMAELVAVNEELRGALDRLRSTQDTLRVSEERYRLLSEISPVGIFRNGVDGQCTYMNEKAAQLVGYPPADCLGLKWINTLHPDDRQWVYEDWKSFADRSASDATATNQFECRHLHPDGKIVWVLVNIVPERDSTGTLTGYMGTLTDITDRQQAEINTQESLAVAVEAAQMGTWYWDAIREVSPVRSLRHDRIFGYDTLQPEWSREICRRHIVVADREIFDAAFDRAMATGKVDFEVRVQWPDGSIHWIAAQGRFDFDPDGNVTYGYGVNFDITEQQAALRERKQAEVELQAQQRLLEQVTESTTAILYIYDLVESKTIYANAQVETILGYTPAAICAMGANLLDLVHPNDVPVLLAALEGRASAADGKIVESEYRMRDVNGEWHWLQSHDRVLTRTADGAVQQTIGTAIDITLRKQSAQKIEEQAALLDIATDAILVRDLEHRILYWNRGAERLYGWTAAEAIGQKAHELLGENPAKVAEIAQVVLDLGEWQGEIRKVNKAGAEVIVEGRWTLARDECGQPQFILSVNTDITAKKSLETQFYQAQRLESLGTLASGIAHDLNNVLTPILGFAQILRWQTGLDDKTHARLQVIEDSARRGAEMVKQILTFASGAIDKHIALQVNHLLREVIKVAQQTFPKSIDFDLYLPNDLWLLTGDSTQLHQVFLNLFVNARDAMPHGGTLRITTENHAIDELFARSNLNVRAGNYVLIKIADTGTGIPPEIIDRIFDPFFTTKQIGEGTGLGLATVLGIVTNHGGFVRVTSTPGQGTEFKIYLPTAEGEDQAIATDSESVQPNGNGELILVVDDDPIVREANRSLLEEHNYQTLIASDGIEAMAIYAQQMQAIDLVLIDAMMPNVSGATAIRTICQMNPQVKILAISGLPSNQQSMLEAGARAFIAKPYQLTELLKTVSKLLDKS